MIIKSNCKRREWKEKTIKKEKRNSNVKEKQRHFHDNVDVDVDVDDNRDRCWSSRAKQFDENINNIT